MLQCVKLYVKFPNWGQDPAKQHKMKSTPNTDHNEIPPLRTTTSWPLFFHRSV